ncbi:electron transfer flavoprotein subunit alpha/FixB family protein [Shewanella pealeana]|uniref:Electron transfer flavoprotein subunit alpha n=1 Tax=Shewanella pealeana (strain ATCC 700345 / ANG-SQ1) TaxID=398579 RepID=A8H4G7_SHEPA|nr:FAD-binding protein [Shewanella pealeana]ABV87454.1 Electron transfer flavoprotein alpha subunit [Shewanella pealeana ATCC 700345]
MKLLVIAEHDNTRIADVTFNAIQAAAQLASFSTDAKIELLIAGDDCQAVANEAVTLSHVDTVRCVEAAHYQAGLAENLASLVVEQTEKHQYQAIIAASSSFGKNVAPRIAALLDVSQISDVTAINGLGRYTRPIYAGNIMLNCETQDPVQVLTIRPTAFDKVTNQGQAECISESPAQDLGLSRLIKRELSESDRPELGAANIIISGGRGLGSGDNYKQLLEPLADKLGAALGASRAAVDAGYVPNDYQVGQTGKIVAPELYIAVGISGAIQHLAGMSDSQIIVAINKDPDAPIFQVADYGLVGDLFTAIPELTGALT